MGHVDCSSPEGTPICEYMGIMNLPAGSEGPIYWGAPFALLPFPKPKPTYDDLEAFILGGLRPECALDRDEYCTDAELAQLRESPRPGAAVSPFVRTGG